MNFRYLLALVTGVWILFFAGCTEQTEEIKQKDTQLKGAYLGQTVPGDEPQLFAAGVVSTGMSERDMAINSAGTEIFYSIQLGQAWAIISMKMQDGIWSKPQVAPFSGNYHDLEPFFAPDGSRLYFVSNRPLEEGGEAKEDYDIWYVDRAGDSWGEPINIGAPVNSDANEFYPAITEDGTIYWTATYEGGSEDLHRARLVDGKYVERETLDEAINSPGFEFNAYVSPDESILIFSTARRGDVGGGDLYISFRGEDGSWSQAKNMGTEINSAVIDYCPFISSDGEYFFFTSRRTAEDPYAGGSIDYHDLETIHQSPQNGLGDIYWMSTAIFERLRPQAE